MVVNSLRSALELLKNIPGQLLESDVEVDPKAELAGVYRYVGAGGTVARPTKKGPAMIFNNVKDHPDARVAIGVLASRKRVAALLDAAPEDLGKLLYRSVENPIPPILALTSTSWFPLPLTPRTMPGLTSRWECAMPPILIPGYLMSPSIGCVSRERTNFPSTLSPVPGISEPWQIGQKS